MREFSQYLGIPQSTLTNYIKGKRRPSSEHLIRIALHLGQEIYAFLGMENHEIDDPPKLPGWLRYIKTWAKPSARGCLPLPKI